MAAVVYFCDLALDFDDTTGDPDGNGSGAVYRGPGGFCAAINGRGNATALAAGDTLYVKGTADLSKLIKVTVDDDKSGTWAIGDVVQNHNDGGGASGDDWVGELCFIDATTVVVQINAASGNIANVDAADGIDNTTRAETIAGANMTAAVAPGIDTTGGASGDTTTGCVKIIGCDASWVARAAQAILDGDAAVSGTAATSCVALPVAANFIYWHWENVTFQNAAVDCMHGGGKGFRLSVFRQCKFLNAGADGVDCGYAFANTTFIQCAFENNGTYGFSAPKYNTFLACRFVGNTSRGVLSANGSVNFIGCLFHDNGDDGLNLNGLSNLVLHCVFDGTDGTGSGIYAQTSCSVFIGNRICNHASYGLESNVTFDESTIEDWNVFHGNNGGGSGLDTDGSILTGRHSYGGGANHISDPADDGYDAAGDDFNVVDGKELDSVAINLDWDA